MPTNTLRNSTLTLLLLIALPPACSKPAPQLNNSGSTGMRAAPRIKLHSATAGLLPRHSGETPLLEKVACIPPSRAGGKSRCHLQRVYGDGSLYLLPRAGGSGSWHHLARLKPGTVKRLSRLFQEVCKGSDPTYGNDNGSFVYRVQVPGCTRELVVTGIPAGGLKRLSEVAPLINGNMIPGSSEAKPAAPTP